MGKMKLLRRHNIKIQARKRRFRFFAMTVLGVFCLFSLIAGSRYLSLHLSKLQIQSIVVQGTGGVVTQEWVLNKAQVHEGMPLFSVNLKEVVHRLEQEPWINQVRVSRRLPHTLIFQITRHEPKLILNIGKLYYVGSQGELFKELEAGDSRDFPIISGFSRSEMEQDPSQAKQMLGQALKLVSLYETQEVYRQLGLSEIHYKPGSGFDLFPEKEHFKIIVGFNDFDIKLNRLSAAIEKLRNSHRSFASIDLNYDGKVILTL